MLPGSELHSVGTLALSGGREVELGTSLGVETPRMNLRRWPTYARFTRAAPLPRSCSAALELQLQFEVNKTLHAKSIKKRNIPMLSNVC